MYIIGHKNPDTDSICSVIAYAELKKKTGFNAIPARLGEINRETKFVLDYFGIRAPEYLSNVKTQVSDLDIDIINPVSADISIKTAWTIMKKNNVKVLPVIDENDRLIGIVTLSDITNKYMDTLETNIISSSNTPLRNIVETLNAKLICGIQENFITSGKVVVAAMTPDEMEPFVDKGDIVLVGNRKDSQFKAIELGAACIIITCNGQIDKDILDYAEKNRCIAIATPCDTFTTARLINQSIPVGFIMTTENIISFNIDDFVDDIKDKMLQTRYRSYPVVDNSNRVKGFVARYHLISQRRKKVVLLDHNEKAQTVEGIEQAEILEVVDHHRIGDIQTGNPIYFKNEPVGSTSTIVANLYFENGVKPPRQIAGILCAAIISDTMKFKSPTSTYTDIATAEKLAEMANINIDSFAYSMFKEGSSLHGKTPKDILYHDFKDFNLGKYKIGIGQINTVDREGLKEISKELLEYMNEVSKTANYNLLMLLITDILDEGSEVLCAGKDRNVAAKAFNVQAEGSSFYLPGVVSRKKQIIPHLANAVEY